MDRRLKDAANALAASYMRSVGLVLFRAVLEVSPPQTVEVAPGLTWPGKGVVTLADKQGDVVYIWDPDSVTYRVMWRAGTDHQALERAATALLDIARWWDEQHQRAEEVIRTVLLQEADAMEEVRSWAVMLALAEFWGASHRLRDVPWLQDEPGLTMAFALGAALNRLTRAVHMYNAQAQGHFQPRTIVGDWEWPWGDDLLLISDGRRALRIDAGECATAALELGIMCRWRPTAVLRAVLSLEEAAREVKDGAKDGAE